MKFLSGALLIFCCFAQQEYDPRQSHCQIQQRVLWWENDWTDIKIALAECEDANEPYNRLEYNAGQLLIPFLIIFNKKSSLSALPLS